MSEVYRGFPSWGSFGAKDSVKNPQKEHKSAGKGDNMTAAITIPEGKHKEEFISLGSRGPYVSKRVWENGWGRTTIWFDEWGNAIEADYKDSD